MQIKQQSVDLEFHVECGNVMHNCRKESVKVKGCKKSVGRNVLAHVYHCMQHDLGYPGMRSLTASIGIPLISLGSATLYENRLETLAELKYEEYRKYVIEAIFNYYVTELDISPYDNGILNIEACCGRTWMTRGDTSLVVVGVIIEVHTGFIIDGLTSSKYCTTCTYWYNKA